MSEEGKDDVQKALDEQAKIERNTDKQEILKKPIYPPLVPKMKAFRFLKKEFVEYTDGDKYVFKIVAVEPKKYRIGIAYLSCPDVVIGVLPRQFSPHIKRQYYRSVSYLAKIFVKIAVERGWKEYHE